MADTIKLLNVFGDRYWKKNKRFISDPTPFEEIPLVWNNAYGSKDFPENPLGKGAPAKNPDGSEASDIPLPNIENPDKLIGAFEDSPKPAGLLAVDPSWPQRANQLGTFDQQWVDTRWPEYPLDIDYDFFNTAPVDQRIKGFFKGGEPVEIRHMHPDLELIESRLPHHRLRLCALRLKTFNPHAAIESFSERLKKRRPWNLKPHELEQIEPAPLPDEIFEEISLRFENRSAFSGQAARSGHLPRRHGHAGRRVRRRAASVHGHGKPR